MSGSLLFIIDIYFSRNDYETFLQENFHSKVHCKYLPSQKYTAIDYQNMKLSKVVYSLYTYMAHWVAESLPL